MMDITCSTMIVICPTSKQIFLSTIQLTFETVDLELGAVAVESCFSNVHCCSSTCSNLNMDTIHFVIDFASVAAAVDSNTIASMWMMSKNDKTDVN